MKADVGTSVQLRDDAACKRTVGDRLLGTPIPPECMVDGTTPAPASTSPAPTPTNASDTTWVWWLVGGAAIGAALWYATHGGRGRRRRT